MATAALDELVRIADPAFYIDPHDVLSRMRREAPIYYDAEIDCYVLTRYADVMAVSRNPDVWISSRGVTLNDLVHQDMVGETFYPPNVERVLTTDPPRHRFLRKVISPSFTPRAVQSLDPVIRNYCQSLLAAIRPDEPFDFIETIAVPLPLLVIAKTFGLPGDNLAEFRYWSDQVMLLGDHTLTREQLAAAARELRPMNEYFRSVLDERRATLTADDSRGDLLTTLARAERDSDDLTMENMIGLSISTLVAGNETTRNLLGSMIVALASHPDQLRAVAEDPSLVPNAVDESLRWATPVPGFVRTAAVDSELAGTTIRAGQHVYLSYTAANRDDSVFSDPNTFEVRRATARSHVAFGYGEHVCPGASLTRLESTIVFEEILKSYSSWSVGEGATRLYSAFSNGWEHLPVTLYSR